LLSSALMTEALQAQVSQKFKTARQNGTQKNNPLHFLLVDDSSTYHKMMAYRFKILNWTATSVYNGKEAVDLYNCNGFDGIDVILMDKEMPVMTGDEATSRLISMGCKIPIIALTGSGHLYDMRGAMGVLSKPLQIPNLLHALLRGQQKRFEDVAALALVPAKRPDRVVLNPNVQSWSTQDVCRWLTTLGTAYRKYAAGFIDNGITGEMLLTLNHPSHYATLGITNSLHAKRIDVGIRSLRAHVIQRRQSSSSSSAPTQQPSAQQPSAETDSRATKCYSPDLHLMDEEEPMGTGLDSMEMEVGF